MNQGIAESEAERQVLGATHAEVGGYLLGTWGLSDPIVQAVAFHHDPGRSAGHAFSPLAAVYIANVFEEQEQAAGMDRPSVVADTNYLRACGLDPDISKWETLCRGGPRRDGGR
jgi:HD-like signal output (HDOD) protein